MTYNDVLVDGACHSIWKNAHSSIALQFQSHIQTNHNPEFVWASLCLFLSFLNLSWCPFYEFTRVSPACALGVCVRVCVRVQIRKRIRCLRYHVLIIFTSFRSIPSTYIYIGFYDENLSFGTFCDGCINIQIFLSTCSPTPNVFLCVFVRFTTIYSKRCLQKKNKKTFDHWQRTICLELLADNQHDSLSYAYESNNEKMPREVFILFLAKWSNQRFEWIIRMTAEQIQ